MYILKYFFLAFGFSNAFRPINNLLLRRPVNMSLKQLNTTIPDIKITAFQTTETKTNGFLRLIRYKNILPTFFLSASGAFINNPTPLVFLTPAFWTAAVTTISILSASMILNDLCDYNIDKINNARRPLVTGEVTKAEAVLYATGLLIIPQTLIPYMNIQTQSLTNIMIIIITLYTPILKKIPLIKNLTCAYVISFSVIYAGIATGSLETRNSALLSLAATFLFLGSFYSELLLDITDMEGDRQNNVNTIPVLIGKENTLRLSKFLLVLNRIFNIGIVSVLYNAIYSIPVFFIFRYLFNDFKELRESDYSKKLIIDTLNNTQTPMVMIILYYCLLSWLFSVFI